MVNKNVVSLRYTTRQRNFESGLKRYREVLEKEKEIHRIHEVETKLSLHSRKINDAEKFTCYLERILLPSASGGISQVEGLKVQDTLQAQKQPVPFL